MDATAGINDQADAICECWRRAMVWVLNWRLRKVLDGP